MPTKEEIEAAVKKVEESLERRRKTEKAIKKAKEELPAPRE